MPNGLTRGGAIAVITALLSGLALVASASPASAAPFELTVTVPEPLVAGATGQLDVNVYNGGSASSDLDLEVTLPAGLTAVGGDLACVGSACLIGSFGNLAPGETTTRSITVLIDPDYVLDNGGGDPVANAGVGVAVTHSGGGQSATRQVPVGELADLRVTRYANPPVADAGETVTYTIDVDNFGPSTARGATIADTLFGATQDEVQIQSCAFSVSQGGGVITQFGCTTGTVVVSQFGNDVGTFRTDALQPFGIYPGPNPGDPSVVGGRLRGSFRLTSAEGGTFQNQVRAVSLTADPNPADNLTDVTHSFQAVADLSVTVTPDLTTPVPGDVVTYTVDATNSGPSTAQNVVVEHHVPAGMEVLSATATVGSCTTGTPGDTEDPVECLLGTMGPLDPGPITETITVEALVTAEPGTTLSSQAFVRSDTPDRDNSDDGAQADVTVAAPDLLFNPLTPARQFDTRNGSGGVPVGRITAGVPLAFTVSGLHGVPPGAEAVALNVTVTGPLGAGWLRVFPCDDPAGTSSNLNFVAGQTVANAVIAPVDGAGQVCFLASADTHVISDVSGWFRSGAGLTTFTPVREFDTRFGTGGVPVGPLTPGDVLTFDVTGVNGVPAAGVGAVVLNVTAAQSATGGHITAFPCGEVPVTSNINYRPGASVPNLVVAPVGPDGTVCFRSSGTTHLIADVSGWFDAGSELHPLNPSRVFDTRNGLGGVPATRLLPGGELEVDVTGGFGVPGDGVGAVVLNVTSTGSLAGGHITVYPCGDRPLTSNLNFPAGQNVANAVIAPVSPDGTVCFSSVVATHLVVDISGWLEGV
jgi:uncharacterized repeat protein (TIGR01451 family)